jgi:integrase
MKAKINYTGEKALTEEEYKKVLSFADTGEKKLLLMIGAGLGIRRFDMSRIIVRNINFNDHTIVYLEKKKHDAPHTVPLPQSLEQELKIYINDQKKGINDRLFSVHDRQLCNWFYEMLQNANISKRGIHSLRGTCVKLCQKQGWSIEQTAKLINDRVSTVQEHYSVPSASELADCMRTKNII